MFEENRQPETFPKRLEVKRISWKKISGRLIFLAFLIVLTSHSNPDKEKNSFNPLYNVSELRDNLYQRVSSLPKASDQSSNDIKVQLNALVHDFFRTAEYNPVWTDNLGTNEQFRNFLNLLDSSGYYGFPIDYFDNKKIKSLRTEYNSTQSLSTRVELETLTTYSALKLMLYLNKGIVEKDTIATSFEYLRTLPEVLHNALKQNLIKDGFLSVQPDLLQFKKIVNSLPNFIDLQLSIKYTTPKFIDDRLLAKGLYYAGITGTAELDTNENNAKALFKLQEQYNLRKDSILNKETHKILVSLLQYRYYQMCLNLNRLRALQNTDEDFLFVNIPEFRLHVIESSQEKETFNVIVGKTDTPTPIFSSSIEKVVTNPYWTVPKSIVNNEMIQRIRKDSTYLERNGYFVIDCREEVVDASLIDWTSDDPLGNRYFIRQQNSTSNALGLVKFIFPNDHGVYLHDTPSRGLFRLKNRTFSHGCIRLENPDKLAQYLTDKYFIQDSIDIKGLISTQQNNEIYLNQKVKIHIQYITCSGNDNSEIEFYTDIYNRDGKEINSYFLDQKGL